MVAIRSIAEGIVQIPGTEKKYNCVVVRQFGGIVIIEAPYWRGNSDYILAYVKQSYPGVPIKALVSTSQMRIHAAGLKSYAQAGVPIYALDVNADLVRRIVAAKSDGRGLEKPPSLDLHVVKSTTGIGAGRNKLILYPFRGRASRRRLAVYLSGHKLLYASDMYLPQVFGRDYWTACLGEVRDLINREHLDVERVMGIHMPPAAWKDLSEHLEPKQ
jgi:hypothetical protein